MNESINKGNRNHIINGIKSHVRSDGRSSEQYRDVKVEYGVVATAEGSAKVTIGDTVIIAGVKMSVDNPYADTADEGNFMVNVELLPLSNPEFEPGPPTIEAIELARVTDRGIRESKSVDTKELCIEQGKKVCGILVDICPINVAGNLFDACSLATLAALKDAKFPVTVKEGDTITVDYKKRTNKSLPIKDSPLGVTICKVGDTLLVDPTEIEEKIIDSRLTVSSMQDGTLCALQKGGDGLLTVDDIGKMIDLALKKAAELRKAL